MNSPKHSTITNSLSDKPTDASTPMSHGYFSDLGTAALRCLIALLGGFLLAIVVFAEPANSPSVLTPRSDASKSTAEVGIPKLPALEALGQGVFIRPLTDLLPASKRGFEVLPRIGHINITVNDSTRYEMVVLFSLPPGPHKVLVELADPTKGVISRETVEFTLPEPGPSQVKP